MREVPARLQSLCADFGAPLALVESASTVGWRHTRLKRLDASWRRQWATPLLGTGPGIVASPTTLDC
jgi:hypothetical protein